jgi:hypothetical protein
VERKAREAYIRGTSLTSARGKHPSPTRLLPPLEATRRAATGTATTDELRSLRTWQQTNAPKWIRDAGDAFSEDTAAILGTIRLLPQNWKQVNVFPQPDGTYVVYFVSRKGGKDRKIVLPDYDALLELETYVYYLNGATGPSGEFGNAPDWNRRGTDVVLRGTAKTPAKTKKQGNALPRKRTKK